MASAVFMSYSRVGILKRCRIKSTLIWSVGSLEQFKKGAAEFPIKLVCVLVQLAGCALLFT